MPSACRFLAVFLIVSSLLAVAQTRDQAALRGRILDQSGAAVPGAHLTLTNPSTSFSRGADSDAEGQYAISGLPLTGTYVLSVEKPGFSPVRRDAITLRAGQAAIFDFKLGVAGAATNVTVYGANGTVNGETPQLE